MELKHKFNFYSVFCDEYIMKYIIHNAFNILIKSLTILRSFLKVSF